MKYSLLLAIILISLCVVSCEKKNTTQEEPIEYTTIGQHALVVVVENREGMKGTIYEQIFNANKEKFLSFFAKKFSVRVDSLLNLDLDQIMEKYWEEWLVNEFEKLDDKRFQKVFILTDESATPDVMYEKVKFCVYSNMNVDVILCLHGGSKSSLCFQVEDHCVNPKDYTDRFKHYGVKPRILYQTGSFGSDMISNWENTGIMAVNGSEGINELSLFTPLYFYNEFLDGKSFSDAVESANQKELELLRSDELDLDGLETILTDQTLKGSQQKTGGRDKSIRWINIPKEKK